MSAQYNRILTNYIQGGAGMNGFLNTGLGEFSPNGLEGMSNGLALSISYNGTKQH